jgi:hypothetical protein
MIPKNGCIHLRSNFSLIVSVDVERKGPRAPIERIAYDIVRHLPKSPKWRRAAFPASSPSSPSHLRPTFTADGLGTTRFMFD